MVKQTDKPVRRAAGTEARKIEAGGKRMPGGVMSAQAADDMQHLVDALYAPSRLMVIERAVGEARQRLKSKGKL